MSGMMLGLRIVWDLRMRDEGLSSLITYHVPRALPKT